MSSVTYQFSGGDITVFFVLTPMAILISLIFGIPNLMQFKEKVLKQNLLLLYLVMGLNIAKCITEMVDLIILKNLSSKNDSLRAQKHCEKSTLIQVFVFDLANCFTVSQIFKLRKHIEDPLGFSIKKVAKPIALSLVVSIVHVVSLNSFFKLSVRQPVTCYVVHTGEELL